MLTDPANLTQFTRLVEKAQSCRICPRMDGRRRVLSLANGNLAARAMFVAEAPGRLGAERSGVPLCGDQAGRNFDHLLSVAGLSRDQVFVTNAVLCNPQDSAGRNAPPSALEARNCSVHLASTIGVVQPDFVVALGSAALRALSLLEPHGLLLARDVGTPVRWLGRTLVPLYHPGSRARVHRSLHLQQEDFRRLGELVRTYSG